jgi:hypothetical protein
MTTREIHQYFPDADESQSDDNLILPMTHPNCRCMCVGASDDWGYTDTAQVILAPPDITLDDILARQRQASNSKEFLEGKLRMHVDYWLIRHGFLKAFGPQLGGKMFRQWVQQNKFRVTKGYGHRFDPGQTENV